MFWDGNHIGKTSSISVDGSRGRKNDVCNIVSRHRAEKCDTAVDIDAIVLEGNFARFSHCLLHMSIFI